MGSARQDGDGKAKALTSWNEIADYLGKGVRTVQRWERQLGLPIKRMDGSPKQGVLAWPQDLDNWLHQSMVVREADVDGHDGNAHSTDTPPAHATARATMESVRQRALELAGHARRLSLKSAELSLNAAELLRRSEKIKHPSEK
jgi:hypothetical protein